MLRSHIRSNEDRFGIDRSSSTTKVYPTKPSTERQISIECKYLVNKITTNKWWLLEEKIILTKTDEYMKSISFAAFFLEGAKFI